MGKGGGGDFLTPKAIANRIKSKGLGRLRWYCQMCQKQCRDANGFKCHCASESHLRQMKIFQSNPNRVLDTFSAKFEKGYLDTLSRRHTTKRMHSNVVYNEYIADKNHVHMNATQWESLTAFVKYLGKEGKCVVDETEKGWYVTWIDNNPAKLEREAALKKKAKHDIDDADRQRREIRKQVQLAKKQAIAKGETLQPTFTELKRKDNEKVELNLSLSTSKTKSSSSKKLLQNNVFGNQVAAPTASTSTNKPSTLGKRKSGIEALVEETQRHKMRTQERAALQQQQQSRKQYTFIAKSWLTAGLVVKLVSQKYEASYVNSKAVVSAVDSQGYGTIVLLKKGSKTDVVLDRVKPSHCETVLPALGNVVLLLSGANQGLEAKLLDIDVDKYCCKVKLLRDGTVLKKVEYEDVCKLFE